MKNWRVYNVAFFVLFLSSFLLCKERTGQSFMFTRPIYHNVAAQRSLFHSFAACKQGNVGGILQIMPMYRKTLSSGKRVRKAARYFFINEKSTLVVKGENAPQSSKLRDVRAEWFELPATFDGTINIKPKQQQFGVWIEYQQNLKRFTDWHWLESLWFDIALPIQHVKNDLQFSEDFITAGTTPGPTNMREAFVRDNLKFGKIGPAKSRVSVAELSIKFGRHFLVRDGFEIDLYSQFIIPTNGPQKPNFLFDPFLGNNRHFGWGSGVNFQLPLNDCIDSYVFAFFFEIENIMLIRTEQKRIIEIKNKPWSRYLLLHKKDGTMNIPAANVLTRNVTVEPFNYVDLSGGWRWYNNCFEAEIGYSLWMHGSEELTLSDSFSEEFGIAGEGTFVNQKGITVGRTASNSTIDCRAPNDVDENNNPTFVTIRKRDLDLTKGIARTTLLHRVHVSTGYRITCQNVEGFFGVGGFVEIPSRNTSLASWGIWAKGGLSI